MAVCRACGGAWEGVGEELGGGGGSIPQSTDDKLFTALKSSLIVRAVFVDVEQH